MSKKQKVVISFNEDGTLLPVEEQKSMLAKSVVLNCNFIEENEALQERISGLEARLADNLVAMNNVIATAEQMTSSAYENEVALSELDYWKRRSRRFWGCWHVSVKVDLTPWSWQWKPRFPNLGSAATGHVQFCWLFLCVEAVEA